MPIIPILMLIVWVMGLMSISFLGFRYVPGPMACVCNVVGILTIFWAAKRFFDKKDMFDWVQYTLHTVYTVCIVQIWWGFAKMTNMYLSGEDIKQFVNPLVYAEGSSGWLLFSAKWIAMVAAFAFVLYWVIEGLRAITKWWNRPKVEENNIPMWLENP